jgi:hypothetical protein
MTFIRDLGIRKFLLLYHLIDEAQQLIFLTILVDLQLDAQNSYLFTYNTFIKILYMFRALPCSSSGGLTYLLTYSMEQSPF